MSYDPQFIRAAAERAREMADKCETTDAVNYSGMAAGRPKRARGEDVYGIEVSFMANGFLVSPQIGYTLVHGPSGRVAHVASNKDELLKLIGEMIDAHAPK